MQYTEDNYNWYKDKVCWLNTIIEITEATHPEWYKMIMDAYEDFRNGRYDELP